MNIHSHFHGIPLDNDGCKWSKSHEDEVHSHELSMICNSRMGSKSKVKIWVRILAKIQEHECFHSCLDTICTLRTGPKFKVKMWIRILAKIQEHDHHHSCLDMICTLPTGPKFKVKMWFMILAKIQEHDHHPHCLDMICTLPTGPKFKVKMRIRILAKILEMESSTCSKFKNMIITILVWTWFRRVLTGHFQIFRRDPPKPIFCQIGIVKTGVLTIRNERKPMFAPFRIGPRGVVQNGFGLLVKIP